MIRDQLEAALRNALGKLDVEPPATITLERPARREHGDWSSNVALASAKAAKRNPRELATQLADLLTSDPPPHVTKVEVEESVLESLPQDVHHRQAVAVLRLVHQERLQPGLVQRADP